MTGETLQTFPSRRIRWRRTVPLLVATLIAMAITAVIVFQTNAPHPGTAGAPLPVLKVASQRGGTKSLMLAAGVLDGAPFRVEWSEFPAAQNLLEALGAGAVDVGGVGDAPFIFAYVSGLKIKAVQAVRAAPDKSSVAVLERGDSPLRTAADLKGRKIATGRGSVGHYALLRALDEAKVSPAQVQIIFLPPGDAKAAFSSGSVDAWATWNPYVATALLHDGAKVLVGGPSVFSGYSFQAATEDAIRNKPAVLTDFLRRLNKADAWARSHQDAYAQVLAHETGLPLDVAKATVVSQSLTPVPLDQPLLAELRKVLARFKAAGATDRTRDLTDSFAPAFNAALEPK